MTAQTPTRFPAILRALAASLALCLATLPAPAETRPPLGAVPEIWQGLTEIARAYLLSEECPTVEGRRWRANWKLLGLYRRALDLGYSRAEVKAFVENPAERARLEREVRAWVAANGVEAGRPDGYCALAQREMAARTPVGALLRGK